MTIWKTATALPILLGTFLCSAVGQTHSPKAHYSVYQVGGDVRPPHPLSTPMPAPPDNVKSKSTVRLSFVVAPDGSVADIRLLKPPRTELDEFAVGVVSKWKFEPATKEGKPVAVRLETEMHSHK